jgi:hypothetical protein
MIGATGAGSGATGVIFAIGAGGTGFTSGIAFGICGTPTGCAGAIGGMPAMFCELRRSCFSASIFALSGWVGTWLTGAGGIEFSFG